MMVMIYAHSELSFMPSCTVFLQVVPYAFSGKTRAVAPDPGVMRDTVTHILALQIPDSQCWQEL
jgi:hypothetical protein